MTIEAAVLFPVIVMLFLALLAPLKVMEDRRRLQNAMEASLKDMTLAAYAEELGEAFFNKDSISGDFFQNLIGGAAEGAAFARIFLSEERKSLKNLRFGTKTAGGFSREGTSGTEGRDGETVPTDRGKEMPEESGTAGGDDALLMIEMNYEVNLPFPVFHIEDVPLSSVACRRAWVGAEGGRGRSRYGDALTENGWDVDEDGDTIVYIGKTGTRYHKDAHCHYIDNQLKGVAGNAVDTLRNQSGGKYHPCASCKPAKEGTVYVFENGSSYHKNTSCGAIGYYAEAVKKKDAEHLGPCSYCSKN